MVTKRTKQIATATTLTIVALLGWFIVSDNFDVELSPDIRCRGECYEQFGHIMSDCVSYFNITSKYYTYYFYNKEKISLKFSPEIDEYWLGINDGRYKEKFRPLDLVSSFYKDFAYVLKLNMGKKRQFKIIGCKSNPSEDIKWGGFGDLVKDLLEESITGLKNQIWKKQPLKEIEECETVYWNETNNIYDYVTHKNGTTGLERVSDVVTIFSKQECKPVKYEVEGENILKKDWNCNLNTLLCDSCKDGNCDGIVQSGESYLNLSEGLKRELDYNLKVFE